MASYTKAQQMTYEKYVQETLPSKRKNRPEEIAVISDDENILVQPKRIKCEPNQIDMVDLMDKEKRMSAEIKRETLILANLTVKEMYRKYAGAKDNK